MKCAVIVLSLSLAVSTFGDDLSESRQMQREARAAYQAKNYAGYLDAMQKASALRPSHPTLLFNLAGALALNGQKEASLATLERVARMGMVYDPSADGDFDSIRDSERFRKIMAAFQQNRAIVGNAKIAHEITPAVPIAEGLAWDGRDLFVTSVRNGELLKIAGSTAKPVASNLPTGTFGVSSDSRRGVLWVAGGVLPQFARSGEAAADTAALYAIDRSGTVTSRIVPQGKHLFGDLLVTRGGDVLVSDGSSPVIHRVAGNRLEPYFEGNFASMQGLAEGNGGFLYASDYSRGIYAIDTRTRDAALLRLPADTTLLGVDGIYSHRGALIAIQNGTNPFRVLRLHLASDGLTVTRVETLLANHPAMTDPTLATIRGDELLLIANAGWNHFDEKGQPKGEGEKSTKILAIRLR